MKVVVALSNTNRDTAEAVAEDALEKRRMWREEKDKRAASGLYYPNHSQLQRRETSIYDGSSVAHLRRQLRCLVNQLV